MTGEQAMKQATETAHYYLVSAVRMIDCEFGEGYAKNNPAVLAAFIQVCAQDYHTAASSGVISGLG
ncbi:hypothetical protein [Chitinibacter sp. GC72]|uniref:hypothetical protein n=1 Tax=Chitinibacter sp. GC72 TaxID=1526917 RepID=UPI0012F7C30A|nr:hypothetical protein [Chitinibacter sp. GC72]